MESFIDHDDAQKYIPPEVREHLLGLLDRGRLPPTDDTLHRLTEAWLLKKAAFQKAAEHGGFQAAGLLRRDDHGPGRTRRRRMRPRYSPWHAGCSGPWRRPPGRWCREWR